MSFRTRSLVLAATLASASCSQSNTGGNEPVGGGPTPSASQPVSVASSTPGAANSAVGMTTTGTVASSAPMAASVAVSAKPVPSSSHAASATASGGALTSLPSAGSAAPGSTGSVAPSSSAPSPGTAGFDYGAAVENASADCPVPALAAPDTLPKITKLPDPFKKVDGTAITKKSDWRCRRQEIRKQAEKYVYGERPTPDLVSGTVTDTKISVHVEAMGKSIDFTAKVVLPTTGKAPYPAIINVGSSGISLEEKRILDLGVAVIYYNHYDLGKEGTAEKSRGMANPGKFYDIYGGKHSAGLLMAWSWGASRLIDVIQQSKNAILDVGRLGVTGCSRNGKGAFAIGLFDDRIALTIPHETSTAGVPVYRMVDILNTERTDHNYFGLNWFSDNFEPFVYKDGTSNVVKLPIDTHELVAAIAPRGLLVLENPHQTQMSAPAGHLATAAGAEVYKALGFANHVSYHSNVKETPHCSYKTEYTDLLVRNISKFLKHEDAKTGDFVVGSGGDGKLADWKEWSTPTLAD